MGSHSSNILSIQNRQHAGGWRGWGLADSMEGWRGSVLGLSRRQIWPCTFKHGWDVEGLGNKQVIGFKQTLKCGRTHWWKQANMLYSPPSKRWARLVRSLLARRMGGACSLRCGSALCRLPVEPGRTAALALSAELRAMSAVPAGKTTWQKGTWCYLVQRTTGSSSATMNSDHDVCTASLMDHFKCKFRESVLQTGTKPPYQNTWISPHVI